MAKDSPTHLATPFSEESLTANAAQALTQLESVGARAQALVEQWVRRENAAAVQEAAEHGTGAARKAARRGLNVLKSRGVAIPPRRKRDKLSEPDGARVEALLMAPDGAGVLLISILRKLSGGKVQACVVYQRGTTDVLRIENAETTLPRLKATMERVAPGVGYKPVPVPVAWARHAIALARQSHKQRGVPEPLGFTTAKALLEPVLETAPEHPFDAEGFEFSLEDAKELASDSGALHHEAEFRSWLPPQQAVQELLRKVGEQLPKDGAPDQAKASELLKAEMLAATDAYFTPDAREALIARMKDAGISLLARRGETAGLKLAATIKVVSSCGLVSDPPRDVPFLRAFFEKAVSFLMAQQGGKLNIPIPGPPSNPAT